MFKRKARSASSKANGKKQKPSSSADLSSQDFAYRAPTILPESRTKDYYAILGVKSTCSRDTIRDAYLYLAKLTHPDKNKGNFDAARRFVDVKEAYDRLSDQGMRNRYDQMVFQETMLRSRISEDATRRKGGLDDAPLPGEPAECVVYFVDGVPMVDFAVEQESVDAKRIHGSVMVTYKRLCRTCDSYGYVVDKDTEIKTKDCKECAGSGKKEVRFKGIGAVGARDIITNLRCIKCAGLGTTLDMERCAECKGKGFEKEPIEREMAFDVPLFTKGRKWVQVIHVKAADREYSDVYVQFKYPPKKAEPPTMRSKRRGPPRLTERKKKGKERQKG